MAKARNPLSRVRKIIGAWPEISEKLSHGAPTFWGGRKTFAMLHDNHHGDGRQTRVVAQPREGAAAIRLPAMRPKKVASPTDRPLA